MSLRRPCRGIRQDDAHGGAVGYQTLINQALREYIEGKAPKLENMLRRVLREELNARGKAS